MEKEYLFGFDVGTSESKGVICDFKGNILATASNKHELRTPHPGWAEHDPINDWWVDFKKITAELLEKANIKAEQIAGIGISAIMAAVVPVDEHFNPLRNAILYGIDTRCVPQVEKLNSIIPEDVLKEHGGPVTIEHYAPKMLWVKENEPEVFAKTKMFTIASGFLNGKLTGQNYSDKYSIRSCVPLMDQKTCEWDDEMCKLVCPAEMLPKVAPSTSAIIGHVTEEAARETGLAAGTPVICGTTDAGSEAVSVGVTGPGDVMLMYGSTAFFVAVTDKLSEEATDVWVEDYVIDDLLCFAAGMATTGSLTKWLLNTAAPDLVKQEAEGGPNGFQTLFDEAKDVPLGSDGLICLPYFSGERAPLHDPDARGTYFGLTMRHTRGHIARATLEGIAFGIDQNFDEFRKVGVPIQTVTAVGGGTKNPLWLQIVSDVCNVRQIVPEITFGASYGDALLAGLGIGAISSPDEIKKMVKVKQIIEPDPERHAAYAKYKRIYRELYERNKDLMHELASEK